MFWFGSQDLDLLVLVSGFGPLGLVFGFGSQDLYMGLGFSICILRHGCLPFGLRNWISAFGSQD